MEYTANVKPVVWLSRTRRNNVTQWKAKVEMENNSYYNPTNNNTNKAGASSCAQKDNDKEQKRTLETSTNISTEQFDGVIGLKSSKRQTDSLKLRIKPLTMPDPPRAKQDNRQKKNKKTNSGKRSLINKTLLMAKQEMSWRTSRSTLNKKSIDKSVGNKSRRDKKKLKGEQAPPLQLLQPKEQRKFTLSESSEDDDDKLFLPSRSVSRARDFAGKCAWTNTPKEAIKGNKLTNYLK